MLKPHGKGILHLPGYGGNPTREGTSVDQSQPMQPWSNRDMGVNHRSRLGKQKQSEARDDMEEIRPRAQERIGWRVELH